MGVSRISGDDLSIIIRRYRGVAVSVRYWRGPNWNRILERYGVGFGCAELWLRAIGTTFCALSSGHGPRGLGSQGGSLRWIFYVFWGFRLGRCK